MASDLREFTQSLPMALLRGREAVMKRFRPLLRAHDITEQQWRVIRALESSTGLEVTELADQCFILMPSLTRILKALEARDLVKRRNVDGDNRRNLITITPAGKALFKKVSPHSEAQYRSITETIGADQLTALYRLLDLLDDRL